jgi:hypothetical protein
MGTPHRGSSAASIGAAYAAGLKCIGVPITKFVLSLKWGSGDLIDISNSFRNCEEHLVRIVSFYELDALSRFNKPVGMRYLVRGPVVLTWHR